MDAHDHDDEEFRGAATLVADGREVTTALRLRGHFQPIDGRFHWYGRVDASEDVTELAGKGNQRVLVRTADGEAEGVLSDPDTWNRYRIAGTGRPPFAVETDLPDAED
ncbi:DUF4873 domain-containing protein [Streptoalloteichus hindustanus]|uniref:DUF4873 domain-containing protein n=1 Tax=Streptoalloteichus hindustanus TaxID=2017 RepID=A0A1M5J7M6_STRHI|nr:DUF4873 domain-containing protein [Streptoalloteichus hindustanus]SHG36309.1 protein of unknown function [Streptoalloteichus hindustanus]